MLNAYHNSAIEIGESTYIGLYTCITGYGNNRNILPYSVAVGVPARVISQRQVI